MLLRGPFIRHGRRLAQIGMKPAGKEKMIEFQKGKNLEEKRTSTWAMETRKNSSTTIGEKNPDMTARKKSSLQSR